MLFCCKCILFAGVFPKNLFTDWADESSNMNCTLYNFINLVTLNQCQISETTVVQWMESVLGKDIPESL